MSRIPTPETSVCTSSVNQHPVARDLQVVLEFLAKITEVGLGLLQVVGLLVSLSGLAAEDASIGSCEVVKEELLDIFPLHVIPHP